MSIDAPNHVPTQWCPAGYESLIAQARASESIDRRWLLLEAAHVIGQTVFRAHLQTHGLMLGLALRTRDWPEALGQLFRIALTPLGHLTGRLPIGNPGRATVGAFAPMPVRSELLELIRAARQELIHSDGNCPRR